MGKIVLDEGGNLRKGVFYRFDVAFDDATDSEIPGAEWVIVPRTPTNEALNSRGEESWMWIAEAGDLDSAVEIKECAADPNHQTRYYYTKFEGEAFGGKRISPFIVTKNFDCFALSDDLCRRIKSLNIRGARIDPIDVTDHITNAKRVGIWALQFLGKLNPRIPKFVDVPNRCPYCGKSEIICPACGHWRFHCPHCRKHIAIVDYKHGGPDDKRVPFERRLYRILEGRTWDGSDFVASRGRKFASKRFIDWLLRVHAAPFYAEPVWFCVDGMNDQQKRWFEELQKPLDA
jgi:hypothetical protein